MNCMRSILLGLFAMVNFSAVLSPLAVAQSRIAERIVPQVAQRGVETTVTLIGNQLETVTGILAYQPGMRLVRTASVGDEPLPHLHPNQQGEGKTLMLTLAVAKDAAIGEHLFRMTTTKGLSELLTLWVSPFPCVQEADPKNASKDARLDKERFEKAQSVSLGTTVWGTFPSYSNFDQDVYRVDLNKGDPLRVEFWGSCLSSIIDASITIYGPNQKKILTCDDTTLRERDPFVAYVAKEDGPHYVAAHPYNDDENQTWYYVMHLSKGPRPTIAYPLGGPAGKSLKTTLLGDPSGEIQASIPLPASPGDYEKATVDHYLEGTTIPLHLRASRFANVLEDGADHGTPEKAQVYKGALPIALNGQIKTEGEVDWFRFSAKKGQRFVVHTYAAAMGSTLDPRIEIRPAEGSESSLSIKADDSTWQDRDLAPHGRWRAKELVDPVVVFEPDVDGDYLISISDNQRLFGPEHVYRIEFQPAHDRVWIQHTADYRESSEKRDRIEVPAGASIERTYNIVAPPVTQYQGAFDIQFNGLPKGVTYSAPRATKNTGVIQIIFSAAAGTKPWSGFPEIEFRPVEKDVKLAGGYVHVHTRAMGRGGLCSGFYRKTRRFPLAVVPAVPLGVRVKSPDANLALNAFLDLEVDVDRSQGWKDDVVVRCLWTPPHITASPPLTIPAGESKATFRLSASGSALPGTYLFTLTAHESHTKVKDANITTGLRLHHVSSQPISFEVVEPYLKIDLARSAVERGKKGAITGTVTHIRAFPGTATATLSNLPSGVKLLGNPTITKDSKEISFPIHATEETLLGLAGDIACHVSIMQNGQPVIQSAGVATLRVDQERE